MKHSFDPKEIANIAAFIKESAATQAYDILLSNGPSSFEDEFPVRRFIDKLIIHYSNKEEYGKCAKLQTIQEQWVSDKLISEFYKTND
jgi:hypothetical protein|tara:strand:- start:2473 stop:2736 length:264 start_codon:yes stop_codon:yes gene_type:complete